MFDGCRCFWHSLYLATFHLLTEDASAQSRRLRFLCHQYYFHALLDHNTIWILLDGNMPRNMLKYSVASWAY